MKMNGICRPPSSFLSPYLYVFNFDDDQQEKLVPLHQHFLELEKLKAEIGAGRRAGGVSLLQPQ